MRRSLLAISLLILGCQPEGRTSQLESELTLRATSGVGTSIRRLRKEAGRPPFWGGTSERVGSMTIYLKGPKSLWGTVRVAGANVGRSEVSSLRARVNAEEDGVRIQSTLSANEWPETLVVTYTVQDETYHVVAVKSRYMHHYYSYYPSSLKMGKRRIGPHRITSSSSKGGTAKGYTLIAVEHDQKETVRYFMEK